MKLASILWIVFVIGFAIQGSSLYIIRASCYNRTVAEITKQQLSDRNKDCKPRIDVSLMTQKLASHVYFTGMFILPALFFICFVMTLKQRATRKDKEVQIV